MQDLRELREETGADLIDVKKALEEAESDRERALQTIRVKGPRSLPKREGCSAEMGLITAKITNTTAGQRGTLIEINAETDFVAKIKKFISMAEIVPQAAAEFGISTVEELMRAKTVDGIIKDTIDAVAAIIGEKLDIANVRQVEGEAMDVYLHKSSQDLSPTVGVLVVTDKVGIGVAHDVAMHITAYSPKYLSRDEVPVKAIEKECEALTEATIAEGGPEATVAKVVEDRVNGLFKENVLLDQPRTKDFKTTIGKIVETSKGKATGSARLQASE